MKKFVSSSFILLSSVFIITSCQKEIAVSPTSETAILEVQSDDHLVPLSVVPPSQELFGRGKPIKPISPTPTPTPEPTPTPTPTPSTSGKCLYFDFDGETVSHIQWNGGSTFYCQPSTLSASARAEAMARVQLAFSAYNVTITDQLSVYNSATIKQRVIITPTSAWYPSGGTGVAAISSLFQSSPAPAFVFSDRLYENTKYISDIMMHEAGHTVGLRHQSVYDQSCQLLNSYRPSTIMGSPFDMAQAPWVYGTSITCTTFQDDHGMLSQYLGLR